jgi:branched-chain amino acid transport system ATP-binding protein
LGLAPIVIEKIYALIPEIVASGVSILIVEQDVAQAVSVADRVHCLLEGKTSLVGTPSELTAQQIDRAYFGADLTTTAPGEAPS